MKKFNCKKKVEEIKLFFRNMKKVLEFIADMCYTL